MQIALHRKKSSVGIRRNLGGLPVFTYLQMENDWSVQVVKVKSQVRLIFHSVGRRKGSAHNVNSHLLRERFLGLQSFEECRAFFVEFGPYDRHLVMMDDGKDVPCFVFEELPIKQRYFREAMLWSSDKEPKHWSDTPVEETLDRQFSLQLMKLPQFLGARERIEDRSGRVVEMPVLHLPGDDVSASIWNSIALDKLIGFRAGVCKACGDVFIAETAHNRLYCDRSRCNGARRTREFRNRKKEAQTFGPA